MGLLKRLAGAVAISVAVTASASAADRLPDSSMGGKPDWGPLPDFNPVPPRPAWEGELGGRYWFSSGRTRYDLYALPPNGFINGLVSRLTWTDLLSHSGEIFGRVEHARGYFIKGFVGLGSINSGALRDEDFPPFIVPYSSTNSAQRGGSLAYGTVDLGWAWRSEGLKLGYYAGYHQYHEQVNARGCTQTAGNPFICVPPIPDSVLAITQDTTWHVVRLGFTTEWRFRSGLRFSTDIAWLPFAWLDAKDTHWLRIPSDFSGPIPQRGGGSLNAQLEAILAYQFTDAFSVGIGGRYWNITSGSKTGTQHFELTAVGPAMPQALTFHTDRLGGFLQASYKFGQLRPTRDEPR